MRKSRFTESQIVGQMPPLMFLPRPDTPTESTLVVLLDGESLRLHKGVERGEQLGHRGQGSTRRAKGGLNEGGT
jgi:hypothetical protein